MPRKKSASREEKIAEEYFPVDEEDLKSTVEKVEKPFQETAKSTVEKKYSKPEREIVEEVPKKKRKYVRKKGLGKKSRETNVRRREASVGGRRALKSASKPAEWKPQKISLKENGYELIITEKPQAASKIASALGKPTSKSAGKISYYELNRDGKQIIVACAVGHLFTLKQKNSGSEIPEFNIQWVPNFLARKKDFTKRYYDTISKLAKSAGEITIATDFDVEGEVIGMNIVRFICGQKDAKRMKFSTLTFDELNKSYEQKFQSIFWGQAIAGETRHYLDWFYGINLSRALMNAVKSAGRFKIMSVGRVQGPALNLIAKKEREILKFKSKPYWQVFITAKNSHELELKHNKDIFDKKELGKFKDIVGKKGFAKTEKKEQKIPPGFPFDLTTLQTEAYKFYGITPSRTLQIAQSLYLSGLISYPRTSSQKLPASVDYKKIKQKLAKIYNAEKLLVNEKPIEGKKSDPAHPSIYPTGEKQILSGEENKIYELIARRFLSLFCEDAILENKKIKVTVDELEFSNRGSEIKKKSWLEIYPSKLKEEEVPDMDGEVEVINSRTEQKETQPPKRYSPASIVSELEKKGLGTKATRANILETLYDRGYIKNKSIEATPLGMSLISTLEKYSPIIIDEKLTRNFEKEMEDIQNSKKDFEEKEKKVLEKAKTAITEIAKDFEKNQKKVGEELVGAQDELRKQEKIENTIMQCPKCKKGNLFINYSPKNRRYFVACDSYPDCTNTYPLPPNGIIKKIGKLCEKCNFPMLMRITKGRRPWIFCFNPDCPTNEQWAKKRQEATK